MKTKIKSVIGLLLTFAMLLTIAPVTVFAEDDILDYLTYEIVDGEVTIIEVDYRIDIDIVIPAEIDGYPVTKIAPRAIWFSNEDLNIVISENIREIGNPVFDLEEDNYAEYMDTCISGNFNTLVYDVEVIPEGFKSMVNAGETSFKTIYLTERVKEINLPYYLAFYYHTEDIVVDEDNTVFSSYKGILCDKECTKFLYKCAFWEADDDFTIPDTVVEICEEVSLGDTIYNLQEYPNLKIINGSFGWDFFNSKYIDLIPENIENVGQGAFYGCGLQKREFTVLSKDCIIGEQAIGYLPMGHSDMEGFVTALCLATELYEIGEVEKVGELLMPYYMSGMIDEPQPIPDFTIYGYAGSTAEAYAIENGFNFVALSCEHNYISEVVKEPTFTETGIKADVCEYCGDVINEEEIPMLENDEDVSEDTNTPEDSENDDDSSSLSFIEKIMQFFQKIVDFLKNLFSF